MWQVTLWAPPIDVKMDDPTRLSLGELGSASRQFGAKSMRDSLAERSAAARREADGCAPAARNEADPSVDASTRDAKGSML